MSFPSCLSMASEETSNVSDDDEKSSENKEYNPKLDFFSEQFDPLLALKSSNVVIPVTNAKVYDNIYKYKSTYEVRPERDNKNQKVTPAPQLEPIERRWLPHQLPIKTKRKVITKNVFTRMERIEGPLKFLLVCKEKRQKVKVWTRHSHDIRGYCLGYIIAFDKHWNLILEDVDEVWTRPKRRKIPALDSSTSNLKIKPKVLPPPIKIIKSTKKTETCSRHVNQFLLRGEHIAFIVSIPDKSENNE